MGTRTEKRDSGIIPNNFPGPGAYAEDKMIDKPKNPQFSLSKANRFEQRSLNSFPGPGNYESPSKITEGPGYSMRMRTTLARNNVIENPGPGSYNAKQETVFSKTATHTFGLKHSVISAVSMIPGPGNYKGKSFPIIFCLDSNLYAKMQSGKFGRDPRGLGNKKIAEDPGPGAYETDLGFRNNHPKYGFGSAKRADPSKSFSGVAENLGPGSY